jgi:putative DNA primase/helicase
VKVTTESGITDSIDPEFASMVEAAIWQRKARRQGAEVRFLCPAHEDTHPSARYHPEKHTWYCDACQAGGGILDLAKRLDIAPPEHPKTRRQSEPGRITAIYDYRDEARTLLYQTIRYEPKDFVQRRPDGKGGHVWNLHGARLVLYRLPEIIAADQDATVYVVEGEKDADNAAKAGILATTSPLGAGKWRTEYAEFLRGRYVVALPDNDDAGRSHSLTVASSLFGVAARVKVLDLPGLPPKGDLSDWLAAGGDAAQLATLADVAPTWMPRLTNDLSPNGRKPRTMAPIPFNLTDYGNAERLVAAHGGDLRYCHPWQKWLAWDNRRWAVDDTAEVERRGKLVARQLYFEAAAIDDKDLRQRTFKWATGTEANHRLSAMMALARSEPGIPVRSNDLDADPWALNCRNGTVDLRTGDMRCHCRTDMLTKLAGTEFQPAAEAPLFHAMLERILPDPEVRAYLQQWAGYCLTASAREHRLPIWHGGGANGKSTLLGCLLGILGDYGKQAAPDLLIAKRWDHHPTELADLFGTRLAASVEVGEGRKLAETLVKQLTGGDRMSARFMRGDFFQWDPTHKLVLVCNHKPVISGTDLAIWRRVDLVPFTVTIPEAERDPDLPNKLRAEYPGILAWAVEGCLSWQANGLCRPEAVRAASEAYRSEMDVLGDFVTERCEMGPTWSVAIGTMYTAYVAWAKATGEEPIGKRDFGLRLRERGIIDGRDRNARLYVGVRLSVTNVTDDPVHFQAVDSHENKPAVMSQMSQTAMLPTCPNDSTLLEDTGQREDGEARWRCPKCNSILWLPEAR